MVLTASARFVYLFGWVKSMGKWVNRQIYKYENMQWSKRRKMNTEEDAHSSFAHL